MATQILSNKVAGLIEIISQEVSVIEDFMTLLGKQQEMSVKKDIGGLNKIIASQREKAIESRLLNKKRVLLIAEIKSDNAIEGDLHVSRLIELVDQNQGNRLFRLRETISGLINQIIKAKNQNAMLLSRSREYISRTLELLAKINNPNANYAQNGEPVRNRSAAPLNRKA